MAITKTFQSKLERLVKSKIYDVKVGKLGARLRKNSSVYGDPDISSLPIIDSTKSVAFTDEVGVPLESSNDPVVYTARLTDSNTTLNNLFESFVQFYGEDIEVLISVEKKGTDKQHFHLYYIVNRYIQEERQTFTSWAKKLLNVSQLKNKKYMLAEVKTDNAPIYVMKDGEFLWKGFPIELIEKWKLLSYKKYSKVDFAKEQQALEAKYLTTQIMRDYSLSEFTKDFIQLKVNYKQNINTSNIQSYVRMLYYKKNPDQIHLLSSLICAPVTNPDIYGNLRNPSGGNGF